jgi:hippurate hydrolase
VEAAEKGGPAIPSHHSPFFRVDGEAVVKTGAHAMTAAVMELLRKDARAGP